MRAWPEARRLRFFTGAADMRQAAHSATEEVAAEVLPENGAMLDVFRDGFDAGVVFHAGIETVVLPTSAWRLAQTRFGYGDSTHAPGNADSAGFHGVASANY